MTDSELNHLVKMANQIADNLSRRDPIEVVADRVADHMKRFWAPKMRNMIKDIVARSDADSLDDIVKIAIKKYL